MLQRKKTHILTALAFAALAVGVQAEDSKPVDAAFAPVPGGMSDRLAALEGAVKKGPEEFRQELAKVLETARTDAHKLVNELVDSEDFDSWLDAMSAKDTSGFAEKLRGKSSEQVRTALHGRLDRRLSKLGSEISTKLQGQDPSRLQASFELALKDLAREEENIQKASEQTAAPADAPQAPTGSPQAPADSPRAPYWAYMQPGGVRSYNAYGYGRNAAYNRTLAVAQQRAWFSNQLAATQWNARVGRFNNYLYGRRQPWYSSNRYQAYHRSRVFPAGYYYRPDRVERVVRRGLWGAAAVAATPFALVASLF